MVNRIGLVGVGLVGTAIAERLFAKGFNVVGFDVNSAKRQHLAQLGGNAVGSPAEVAQQANRIVLSLPDTQIVREVVEGPDGLLQANPAIYCGANRLTPPSLWRGYIVDTTTGDPDETVALALRLADRGVYFLDAAISGSSRQVRNGQAVFMVGGDRTAFEACADIFEAITEKVFYLGPSGSGSKAKLASNLILGLNRLALAEGLVFAGKLGLDLQTFLELLKVTPAYSAAMDSKGKKMLSRDFTPEARIRQHYKDVSLILKYAEKASQELPLSRVHLDILENAMAAGNGEMDNSAIIREIERRRKL